MARTTTTTAAPNQGHPVSANFVEHLRVLAQARPDDVWLTVAGEANGAYFEKQVSYAVFESRVRALAAFLQQQFAKGDRALVMLDNDDHYAVSMLACFYAGVIAVPVFPPESMRPQHLSRLTGIAEDSQAGCVLTSSAMLAAMDGAAASFAQASVIAVDAVDLALADAWMPSSPAPDDAAFLQYTSGSTSAPKGVIVTHGNLMANERAIRDGMGIGPDDKFMSWAPLYHDMGLIGGLMQPLYSGIPLVLTSPRYFLESPVRWLELISRHRATLSGGPDFAYRLCLDRVKGSRLAGLDLSSWRVAYTGAEPVRADTETEFIERFAAAGFDPGAAYPCYGLAEATLFVTGGKRGGGLVARRFSADALARGEGIEAEEGAEGADATLLVGCGAVPGKHEVRITDPESLAALGAGSVGEIWVAGPSVCAGYWGKPEATRETFAEHEGRRWLRTGDLGFQRDGQLYVTGRIKDLIIVRGHNIYPQDIERTVEAEVEAVRKGRVAAFAVTGPQGEGIGVAAEVSRSMQKLVAPHVLVEALGAAVSELFGEAPAAVVLLNPGALPKTSSGKLQRQACRAGLAARSLDAYAIHEHGTFTFGGGAAAAPADAPVLDDVAQAVADIWSEVLRRLAAHALAPDAHFFTSGGNSLAAVQVAARIAHRWNIDFSIRDLFEQPRLNACADTVRGRIANPARAPGVAIEPLSAERRLQPLPLSHAQERQWFLWKLSPQSTAYHMSGALRLSGVLDAAAMHAAFEDLAARHESLRTVFLAGADGTAEQLVSASWAPLLALVDLRHLAPGEREAHAADEARRLHDTPFDLTQGPLVRVALLRLSDTEHVLVLVMHHIISDGASMQVLLDELAAGYAARLQGSTQRRAAARIQYVDHAVWQRGWLAAGEAGRQLAWWRAQLGDEHPVLALPTDRPRTAQTGHRAARHTVELPATLLADLRQSAAPEGATLFMVLLAGFQALLHRHTGMKDIRVGAPVANRGRVEAEGVVGFFVNTLVLRNVVGARMRLSDVVAQAREAVMGAQTHQDLPFEQLVEALQPQRSLSQTPLFQVMFNHLVEDYRAMAQLPGLEVTHYALPDGEAQFELVLEARETPEGRVTLGFVYASELFDRETIKRMAGHYVAVLQALASQPELAVGDVALVGEAERAKLSAWSENNRVHEDAQPVHRQIEAHARLKPSAPALVFCDEALSYSELNARANRLAHRLIALGVRPDTLVGICVERSTEMMVGILAVLKAGGAYVPLDPEYPADRLSYMVQDSGIELLLTQSHLRSLIPGADSLQMLALDTLDTASEPALDPQVALHGEHLAYVIYTSGSTGRPKGAAIRHAALYSCMAWMQSFYTLEGADTVLHKAPFGFDVSVWEMFWPLTSGARLVIANPGDHRDPVRLVELIRKHQVTTLNFVPSMLQAFLAYEGIEETTNLKHIICGGEAMPAATQKEALQRLSGATLQNLYGPTETTIHVTQWTCRDDGSTQVPIGRPISDTQAYVLDGSLNEVPVGVAGELYLGGINLARGYLKRAGLTAERFVATENGQRLYRTGDLVRWSNEGQLEYLGRIDHQVKVRGFRIELGEVEAQLQGQAEVREAVVVANEGPAGTRLVGYVSGQGIDTAILRERLGESLPDYMVPSVIVVLDALPLNANGKVDRKALPAPEFTSDTAYEAPEGEVEQALAAIWAEVLGVARVGRSDNFFELGGDSILSLKVTARAARAGVQLNPRQVFEHQTLSRIARAARGDQVEDSSSIPALAAAQRNGALALSHAQMRQWFLWQLDPQSTAYHISGALKLSGSLDVSAVRESFDALVQRHESLRTVFRTGAQGLAEQVIRDAVTLDVASLDLSAVGDLQQREARSNEEVLRLSRTPFDLSEGSLVRVGLIRLAPQEHLLVVVMHHIVSDGWSMQVIVDEFVAHYSARVRGEAVALQPLPIQYADYAAWQRDLLEAGERDRQLAYWKQHLGDAQPVLQLPTDHARKPDGRYSAVRYGLELPRDLVRRLHKRVQGEGATLFMGLLAAFQVLLGRYTGENDIRIGVPIANRHRAETEGVIGFFVNTQVLRNVLDSRDSLQQVLVRARDAALGAQAHQDLPFEQLVEALQPERSLSASPLFQVMFNHQRGDLKALKGLPGLELTECDLQAQSAQFELTLETSESTDGSVRASFSYAQELFEPRTIARMAGHYLALLEALADRPHQAVRDVTLMALSEQYQLRTWSENPHRYDAMEPVHRLIERQAQHRPAAPALVFGAQTLSYGELNARANRLSRRLISLGVGPEVLVGIAVERSIEMVVGILAIVKAGGAYVPLDPEYPAERLAYMLEDSGIAMLLTQSHLRALIPGVDSLRMLELDTLDTAAESDADPQVALHGENLAYVIYTSGSTGRPKGAANRHRSLFNRLAWMQEAYRLGEADTVLQKTPFSFDVSVWEFFWPLMHGARLVVADPGDHRDPARLVALITQQQVNTLHFVPSMLQAFLAYEDARACTSLKRIVCSGEALPAEARDKVFACLPQAALYNLYGPTEAAIDVTHWTCRDDGSTQVPIGRPISDTQAYVLDGSLNEVPVGVAGELYLGGINLARGYLKRAGLTAERFIATENGNRLYRTGDLVRWSNEGQLEYLGRIDHQVKVRGFRIELGEVEAQLQGQPEVREAVVVANDGPAGNRLVGYVSPHAGQTIDTATLRERLGESLPDYMVPSVIVVLDALPLNANGKVDRKALPAPEFASDRAYEAPEGEVEQALAAIWAEVLGVARVGRSDNFFELGGHSLLALRLLESVRARGWRVQVRTLFQHPQLAAFAQALALEQGHVEVVVPPNGIPEGCEAIEPEMLTLIELDAPQIGRIESAVPGGASNIQDIYPLAPLQEGMLFHHLLQSEGDAYITSHALGFDSKERLERFVQSFNQVIARHDILRTAVLWEGLKEPVQVVHRQAELKLQWLEVDGTNVSDQLNACVDPAHYRIDVRQAPMIRAVAAHDKERGRWLLQLPSHHMVLDHTTLDFLVEEISLIQQGRHNELPQPVPFRNYVAQARLGVSQAEHEAFFKQMLGDVDEPTAPFNLLDVQGDGTRVGEARLRLEPQLAQQIRREAQRHGVSAATLFHLAWALVLAKATGKDDVVFGTVLFGRMQGGEGAQRALGLFINTLPLRVKLGARGVAQCVKDTHAALTQLLHHEHANLSLAQRCSALPGGTPLFSALLNYRYTPEEEQSQEQQAMPNLAWTGLEVLGGAERTNYPFGMSVDDLGKGFELVAQVHESVDAQRVCGYMLAAIEGVVTALVQRPQQPTCELGIVSTQEMHQIAAWSENNRVHEGAQPVRRQIEAHARLKPSAPALVFGDEALSYSELNTRANRLAHRLIALGVRPDTLVGICVERSTEMMVGILAVLKAGGAYVPLDPEYPADRLSYMVQDSGIELLLTQSHLRSLIPGADSLQMLALDTLDTASESTLDPQVALHGEHLAYVIYTSGSTGRPKGAAIRHAALYSCMAWMQAFYTLEGADTVLHKAPFGFDVSVWEMFWPLTSGARLVIANPGDHRDPVRLVELIRKHQVTTLNFVPSMLQAFLAYEGIEETTNLKHIICGGEAMPAATQKEALQRLSGATLQNLYGPTETTIHVTQWTCRDDGSTQVPIGRPISDTQAYVLDGSLNEVPVGVAGELYLGGINLARGYLKRAGLTAERFVATENGQRLYRTGDLVRWSNEGQLEYLGRIDHQVKVRGFRIELGEVEAQLQGQPEVREAVVVANDGPAGNRLVGYVSPHAGQTIDTATLRERLGESLPDYMVPSVIVVLDALPLNANGKVDRKALPAPEFASDRAYEAPEGEVEQALAAIWAEVLGVARVGRNDNFFELGGHSLLALRLLESVRARGWRVQVRTLFQHPQLAAFAQALALEQGHAEVVVPPNGIPEGCEAIEPEMLTLIELDAPQIGRIESAVPGGASNIQDIYPLAPLQEGMLFHHLLQSEGDAYITSHALGFDSKERLERFVQSFNQVIARHDILRTAVLWEGLKEPVQVVHRHAELKLQWLEVQADAQATNVSDQLNACVDPAHYRIDVRQAPMIRAVAAHDKESGRWLLQLPSHHMVLDHTTLDFLVEEISLIQQGRQNELPQPVPFRNYVAQARLGVSQQEHEAFFKQMLWDVDEPTAPFNLLDVQGDGTRVEEARLRLEPQLAQQIRREAQRHGVSAATLFHLAWALVLAKATGKDDVVFGTVLFGRMQGGEGAQRALGLFINTLPLRVKLGARGVAQCVKDTHAALTQLLHHEHANLSLAQRCSALPGGTPLFSALLNYRYSPEPAAAEGEEIAIAWQGMDDFGGQERTNYPFGMSIDDLGEDFELVAQIHEAVDARRICGLMQLAVDGIVTSLATHPAQPIRELEVISAAERAQLGQWGLQREHGPKGGEEAIHQRIERHAHLNPHAPALAFGDASLSYGELNARANRLAHRLIALGVKPESRVGLAVERSIGMVVGLLAILKAGGAYVPLDPEYPADRLAYMVRDSGIELLLTQSHLGALPGAQAVQVLALDTLDTSFESDADPRVALHGENLAYVIYTSGSTGRPKGAQLCHRNVTRLLDATGPWFGFGESDVWTMFHSYAFDFSVWEIFGALCTGGKLVVVPFWVSRSPEDFLQLLRAQRVTVLNQTPSAFGQLVALPQAYEGELALRTVIFGGEALDPQRLTPWIAHFGDERPQLINMYGITETTVHVTYRRITQADLGQQRSPVGIAIPDLGMQVLDGQLGLVPVGVAGELYEWGGAGAGVPEASRADGRALRCHRERQQAVPHGRLGALEQRGSAGIPGSHRPPGEGAGVPHRAGGGGGADSSAAGSARSRGRCQRGPCGHASGGLCLRKGHRHGHIARTPGRITARLHGPQCHRGAGFPAAERQRQGGPQGAARAGVRERQGVRGTRRRGRAGAGGHLGRSAGRGPRGPQRQLLRTRRRFHHQPQARCAHSRQGSWRERPVARRHPAECVAQGPGHAPATQFRAGPQRGLSQCVRRRHAALLPAGPDGQFARVPAAGRGTAGRQAGVRLRLPCLHEESLARLRRPGHRRRIRRLHRRDRAGRPLFAAWLVIGRRPCIRGHAPAAGPRRRDRIRGNGRRLRERSPEAGSRPDRRATGAGGAGAGRMAGPFENGRALARAPGTHGPGRARLRARTDAVRRARISARRSGRGSTRMRDVDPPRQAHACAALPLRTHRHARARLPGRRLTQGSRCAAELVGLRPGAVDGDRCRCGSPEHHPSPANDRQPEAAPGTGRSGRLGGRRARAKTRVQR
ncbi:Tyrocidine synthase 3 [Variovorax paradoxus]|uniref:Tyrocidine synthase 3 n=1 Tax=Variovorax paradoxus TaxID=34073 RepID=A0A679J8X1_VARPD|nr:Tyrocidine synthase 3 [Variovorax paradoxus]